MLAVYEAVEVLLSGEPVPERASLINRLLSLEGHTNVIHKSTGRAKSSTSGRRAPIVVSTRTCSIRAC